VYLKAKSPHKTIDNQTPKEAWSGKKPKVCHLQIFGSIGYAWRPSQKKTKLEPKNTKCMFVGYNANSKAYRLVDCAIRNIKPNRNTVFDEIASIIGSKTSAL
jgi:hypothetical protein